MFKAGRYFFEDGLRALAACKAAGSPVVFVTNGGGGHGEEEYLTALKEKVRDSIELALLSSLLLRN